MGRGGRASEMVNLIDLDVQWFNNVLMNQLEVLVADPVLDISLPTSEEIIHHNHLSKVC